MFVCGFRYRAIGKRIGGLSRLNLLKKFPARIRDDHIFFINFHLFPIYFFVELEGYLVQSFRSWFCVAEENGLKGTRNPMSEVVGFEWVGFRERTNRNWS